MTSVIGHTIEWDFDEGFRKWKDCDPIALFEARTIQTVTVGRSPRPFLLPPSLGLPVGEQAEVKWVLTRLQVTYEGRGEQHI